MPCSIMILSVVRYGQRTTERGAITESIHFKRDIEDIKKYLKAHKQEKHTVVLFKYHDDYDDKDKVMVIIRIYPNN